MNLPRVVLVCMLSSVASGCFSGAGLGRATTLPVGETRVAGWIEASALSAPLAGPVSLPWGLLGVGVHHGARRDVEVGGRYTGGSLPFLDSNGLTGDVKIQLHRAPRGIDVALAQSVGWRMVRYGGTPWHALDVLTAVMLGLNLGPHQLVGTVRGGYQLVGGRGMEPLHLTHLDLSIGFVGRISRRWELVPEVLVSGSGTRFNGESATEDRVGTGMLQLAMGAAYVW